MKTKLMAAVAIFAVITAAGAVRAEDASDVKSLKAQAAALKKQNEALEKRLNKLEKQQVSVQQAPASSDFMASVTKGPLEVLTNDDPICLHGVCVFGTIDAGLGWDSHGYPENGNAYFGNALIGKSANHSYFGINPNGLSQSTIGIKGSTELFAGVSGVFMASTGFNPQSGRLASAQGSLIDQNGLNRYQYSTNGDGSRGGQAFNDQLYAGLASKDFGQLTFGRHRSFDTDMVVAYDPNGGSYAFSLIGYSGTPVAGSGDTNAARLDNTFKYRVEYGPMHFGALYKFADGASGSNGLGAVLPANNDGYQFDLGGSLAGFDVDATAGHFNQMVSYGILNAGTGAGSIGGANYISNTGAAGPVIAGNYQNTLPGTITDNTGAAIAAKYTWNQFKFFAGYAYVNYQNPTNGVGIGATGPQGYQLSTVNNHPFANGSKILQTEWVGVKYAYDPKTEMTLAYYHEGQNNYSTAAVASNAVSGCGVAIQSHRAGSCAGAVDAVSGLVDYHFTKRFDIYGGMMVSAVSGGLSNGYLYSVNWAPTAGARFTF